MLVFHFLLGGTTVVLVVALTYSETICEQFDKNLPIFAWFSGGNDQRTLSFSH